MPTLVRQGVIAGVVGFAPAFAWLYLLNYSASGTACTLEGLGCFVFDMFMLPAGLLIAAGFTGVLLMALRVRNAWPTAVIAPITAAVSSYAVFGSLLAEDRVVAPPPVLFVGLVVLCYALAALLGMPRVHLGWQIGFAALVTGALVAGLALHPPTFLLWLIAWVA